MSNTLFRKLTDEALSKIELTGSVLDLGGSKKSPYQKNFKGSYSVTSANLDLATLPDVVIDLEKTPFEIAGGSHDSVLLINVLEHIFNYQALISEAARVLKRGGKIVVVVPFVHAIHPSPDDYFRYTSSALQRIFSDADFTDIMVTPIGRGVVSTAHSMLFRFIPFPIDWVLERTTIGIDWVLARVASKLGKKYQVEDYPLGYCLIAFKK